MCQPEDKYQYLTGHLRSAVKSPRAVAHVHSPLRIRHNLTGQLSLLQGHSRSHLIRQSCRDSKAAFQPETQSAALCTTVAAVSIGAAAVPLGKANQIASSSCAPFL